MTLTWVLIAGLSVLLDVTLFGWVYEGHEAGCERRSRQFAQAQIELKVQGPIHECEVDE
jgi:hypothetical protein